MLDEHAFQLERGNLIVGRLEHIVGAADVGDVTVGVAAGHVARVVVAGSGDPVVAVVVAEIPGHEIHRSRIQSQTDLALAGGLPADGVDDLHRNTGQRSAHRTGLDR
jgi:hypothetical protein